MISVENKRCRLVRLRLSYSRIYYLAVCQVIAGRNAFCLPQHRLESVTSSDKSREFISFLYVPRTAETDWHYLPVSCFSVSFSHQA